jgi:hypothetical protein
MLAGDWEYWAMGKVNARIGHKHIPQSTLIYAVRVALAATRSCVR